MPSIDKIELKNSFIRQNIRKTLGYAVKKRNGYYKDLKMVDERRGETIEKFETVGFVHSGWTLKEKTFRVTELGDNYYKDLFGKMDYWQKRLSGMWERFKADLIDRLK